MYSCFPSRKRHHLRIRRVESATGPGDETPSGAEVPLEDGRRRRHGQQTSSSARRVWVKRPPLLGPEFEQVLHRVVVHARTFEVLLETVKLLLANPPRSQDDRPLVLVRFAAQAPAENTAGEQSLYRFIRFLVRGGHGGERPKLPSLARCGRTAAVATSTLRLLHQLHIHSLRHAHHLVDHILDELADVLRFLLTASNRRQPHQLDETGAYTRRHLENIARWRVTHHRFVVSPVEEALVHCDEQHLTSVDCHRFEVFGRTVDGYGYRVADFHCKCFVGHGDEERLPTAHLRANMRSSCSSYSSPVGKHD